jgi:hypothetical protein
MAATHVLAETQSQEVGMTQRWWFAAIVVTAALMAGCSGKTTTSAPSSVQDGSKSTSAAATSSETSAIESAPASQLDTSQCLDLSGANADLLAANDKDAARKAADTMEKYTPPAKVKDAIEHFVTTGGGHFDDPDFTKNHKLITDWVNQVCPT